VAQPDPGRSGWSSETKESLFLLLMAVLCLFTLANTWTLARLTASLEAGSFKPGLVPREAMKMPPGDGGEFADLSLSDLILGLSSLAALPDAPAMSGGQAKTLERLLPKIRDCLARHDPAETAVVENELKSGLTREMLLFFQKVRKANLGRPRDDAAGLRAMEAHVTSRAPSP